MYDTLSLQRELTALGYNPGLPDGVFGMQTRNALVAFQRDAGLVPDGVPGPKTARAINEQLWRYRMLAPEEARLARLRTLTSGDEIGVTGEELRRLIRQRAPGVWTDTPGHVNLVGIRGYSGDRANGNMFDRYNDNIALALNHVDQQDTLRIRLYSFTASVDPGLLRAPNPKGVAHLLPGHYRYRLGVHKGREPALVQAAAVTVARFFDPPQLKRMRTEQASGERPGSTKSRTRNVGEADATKPLRPPRRPIRETGWFGIHIHRGGMGLRVGEWSAGCQVIQGNLWPLFLSLIKQAAAQGQGEFGYTLLPGSAVQEMTLERFAHEADRNPSIPG